MTTAIYKTCPVCGRPKLKLVLTGYGARLPRHHQMRVKLKDNRPHEYISADPCDGGGEPILISLKESASATEEESSSAPGSGRGGQAQQGEVQ